MLRCSRLKKFVLLFASLVALVAAIGYGVAMKILAVKPYPGPQDGEFVGRTSRPEPDPYQMDPSPMTYEERKQDYLVRCARSDDYWNGLAGLALGTRGVSDASIQDAIARVRERKDCADFRAARLVRFLCGFGDNPLVLASQRDQVAEALKGFKFWKDQGGEDTMIMETENHQILFNSIEYLVGQTFPDDVFPNDGKTGQWHMEHARGLVLDWLRRKSLLGFCEWDSNVYLNESFPAVANLADFAQDETVAREAAKMLDLILFDIGVDLYKGVYGTSHGRTYAREVLSGRDDHLRGLVWLAFGLGDPDSIGGFAAVCMATSPRYEPPLAIQEAGRLRPELFVNRERHGIPLKDAPRYGYRFDDPKATFFFWEMGAYTQPEVMTLSMRMVEEWDCWDQPFFEDIGRLRRPVNVLNRLGILRLIAYYPWIKSHMTLLGEVNKITVKTPDYMLSTAQDYRPGGMGNQQHIWQATLDPDALVFVTSVDGLKDRGPKTKGLSPRQWGAQARFPRACQEGPVHISIYRIGRAAALGEPALYGFTHAYFPQWAFDEVTEANRWTFGRRGDGYVALWCSRPMQWTTSGQEAGHEIVAEGREAVWICQCGRRAKDGPFEDFVSRVSSARLEVVRDRVEYDAPGVGTMRFGWTGPLTVDGKPVDIGPYPRFDNPYCRVPFGESVYDIAVDGQSARLDFEALNRPSQ